jgi:hypothetical protein
MKLIDVTKALIWQYNDAVKFQSLIQKKQDWITTNNNDFWQEWLINVFDLRTANSFGVQVWALILGVVFQEPVTPQTDIWGFNDDAQNYDNGGFGDNQITLTLEQKRTILLLRYRQLTSNASIDEMDRALKVLLPNSQVQDTLQMKVVFANPTTPFPDEVYILDNFDNVIPRPAGVGVERRFGYATWLGFLGTGGQTLDNGTFGE